MSTLFCIVHEILNSCLQHIVVYYIRYRKIVLQKRYPLVRLDLFENKLIIKKLFDTNIYMYMKGIQMFYISFI